MDIVQKISSSGNSTFPSCFVLKLFLLELFEEWTWMKPPHCVLSYLLLRKARAASSQSLTFHSHNQAPLPGFGMTFHWASSHKTSCVPGKQHILLGFWVLHLCPCLTPSWRVFVLQWLKPEAEHRTTVLHGSSPLSREGQEEQSPTEQSRQQSLCRRCVTRQRSTRINQELSSRVRALTQRPAHAQEGQRRERLLPRSQINSGV